MDDQNQILGKANLPTKAFHPAEEIADDLEDDVETIRSLYEEILKEKTDNPQ